MWFASLAIWPAEIIHALKTESALNTGAGSLAPESPTMTALFEIGFFYLTTCFGNDLNGINPALLIAVHFIHYI